MLCSLPLSTLAFAGVEVSFERVEATVVAPLWSRSVCPYVAVVPVLVVRCFVPVARSANFMSEQCSLLSMTLLMDM